VPFVTSMILPYSLPVTLLLGQSSLKRAVGYPTSYASVGFTIPSLNRAIGRWLTIAPC
jgi:hypothetical protein